MAPHGKPFKCPFLPFNSEEEKAAFKKAVKDYVFGTLQLKGKARIKTIDKTAANTAQVVYTVGDVICMNYVRVDYETAPQN